jgi:hypothetical protein
MDPGSTANHNDMWDWSPAVKEGAWTMSGAKPQSQAMAEWQAPLSLLPHAA